MNWTSRLIVGAALVAAGPLLVYPVEGQAQETAAYKCEFTSKYSLVTIENINKEKKSSVCRWKCIYTTKSGQTHINQGAKKLPYKGTKTSKQGAKDLAYVVGTAGSCP